MPAGRVVLLIALLIGLQPLSTDLYLPALPALTTGFGASMTQAQLTLTVLVLALGVSQLFWGPISDRFGRRPVLLVGMVAYALASVACAMAPSIGLLIFWRAVQGAAMGAGVVCGRAIVRDLYEPTEGARVMSKAMSGLAVIACTSPPLGGLLSDLFGWRVALTTLAVFGLVTLALLLWGYKETIPQKNPQALAPGKLLANWLMVLRHPTFRAFSALTTVSYAGLLDEVQTLRARGDLHPDLPSMRCVGYRQAWEALDGLWPMAELRDRGVFATRQLAKRQITWLRASPDRQAIPCEAPDALAQVLALARAFAKSGDARCS